MMFRKITFLLAVLLVFMACTKEETIQPVSTNTTTPVITFAPAQEILFHYAYENTTTDALKGWFIDKKGDIKTYDLSNMTDFAPIPTAQSASEAEIQNLLSQSQETGISIDVNKLRSQYFKIEPTVSGTIESTTNGTADEGTTTIVAYYYDVDNGGNCGGSSHGSKDDSPYRVVLLKSFGTINKVNTKQSATSLIDWLMELNENENL